MFVVLRCPLSQDQDQDEQDYKKVEADVDTIPLNQQIL